MDFITKYDIVCISESKLTDTDSVNVEGFTPFYKNRTKFKRKSGGILVLIKNHLLKYIKLYEEEQYKNRIDFSNMQYYTFVTHQLCKNTIWFNLSIIYIGIRLPLLLLC